MIKYIKLISYILLLIFISCASGQEYTMDSDENSNSENQGIKSDIHGNSIQKNPDNSLIVVAPDGRAISERYDSIKDVPSGYIASINGKYCILNVNGNEKIKPIYDFIESIAQDIFIVKSEGYNYLYNSKTSFTSQKFEEYNFIPEDLLIIQNDSKFGVINTSGKIVLKTIYDKIDVLQDSYLLLEILNELGIADRSGKIIFSPSFDSIEIINESIIKVSVDGKFGLANLDGKYLFKSTFDDIQIFENGIVLLYLKGKVKPANIKGNYLSEVFFESISEFNNDYATFKINNNYGVIHLSGKIFIQPTYSRYISIEPYKYNLYKLLVFEPEQDSYGENQTRRKEGLVNEKGEVIYMDSSGRIEAEEVEPSILKISAGNEYYENISIGLLNLKNKSILTPNYSEIEKISYDYYKLTQYFENGHRFQILNINSNPLKPIKDEYYSYVYLINKDIFFVCISESNCGLLKSNSDYLLSPKYSNILFNPENPDSFGVEINNKWGFINSKEESIVFPTYNSVKPFFGGYAVVKVGERFGVIDTKGNVVVRIKYDDIQNRVSKYFPVSIKSKWGLLNEKGDIVLKIEYDNLNIYERDKLIKVSKEAKDSLFNLETLQEIKIDFDLLEDFQNGIAIFGKRDSQDKVTYGLLSAKEVIVKAIYEELFYLNESRYSYKEGEYYGLLNSNGKKISQPIYDDISAFSEGYAVVKRGEKFGLIHISGKIALEIVYDKIEGFDNKKIKVQKENDESCTILDINFKKINESCVFREREDKIVEKEPYFNSMSIREGK